MKTSAFSRTLELARMAAKIGIKEVRSGNLKSRLEQAAILADGLGKMKGAAMKAGQLLSLDLIDYFPKEAVEILSRLQSSATAEDFSVIERILKAELGPKKFSLLKEIDPTPIGTASIGQVHRATFHDQAIVVKVQHPGVAESIDSDLKVLKSLAKTFCSLTGRDMDLDPLFKEFKFILEQEVDYLREAELQTKYRELASQINGVSGLHYVVPEVVPELSTRRVLAMEWQSGESLRKWIERTSSREKRERVAHGVLNLYFQEFFKWGLVQTDPNQGNFLIREHDGEIDFVLLDFGATRTYAREFINSYVQLLEATASGDKKKLQDEAIAFGLIDPRESSEAFEALYQVMTVAVHPFFGERHKTSLFDFSDESHLRRSQETTKVLAAKLKFSPPPRDLVFLHRKLSGVYSILKSLGVQLDVSVYWRRMIEEGRS